MRMKNEDMREFDRLTAYFCKAAEKTFRKIHPEESEDMAQDLAVSLAAARWSITKSGDMQRAFRDEVSRIAFQLHKEASSRKRGMKLMDIDAAVSVPDVATPYHFLIAQEIADQAVRLDLDSHMMGDTMEDEAEHYGVSRQRAHQIVNIQREQMSDYLIR